MRLSLSNQSNFSITNAKLEVTCSGPNLKEVELIRSDDLPSEPESDETYSNVVSYARARTSDTMVVDIRGLRPVCHVQLGTLLPGEIGRAIDDLAILPAEPGSYTISVRILGGEIYPPVIEEKSLEVGGSTLVMDLEGLKGLMFAKYYENTAD